MSGDPLTDLETARAFTKQWAAPERGTLGRTRSLICTWAEREPKPERCWAHDSSPHGFQCGKPGKTKLADGSTWCGHHNPAARARNDARKAATRAKWDARWGALQEATERQNRRRLADAAAWGAIRQIADGHNDPRSLAQEVLAMLPEQVR